MLFICDSLCVSISFKLTVIFSRLLCHLVVLGSHGLGIVHARLPDSSESTVETFSLHCGVGEMFVGDTQPQNLELFPLRFSSSLG